MACTDPILINRGEALSLPFTCTLDGMDWTDVVGDCQIRETVEGDLLAEGTVTMDAVVSGEPLTGLVEVDAADTEDLPDICYLAVRLSRASPAWGPHTSAPYRVSVSTPLVRD